MQTPGIDAVGAAEAAIPAPHDLALLVFVVALAHTSAEARSFGLTVTTAVATLATTTVHLIWAHLASSPSPGIMLAGAPVVAPTACEWAIRAGRASK